MALILWIVWIIGFIVALFTAFEIRNPKTKITGNQFMIIVTLCIIIVGGIIVGKFAAMVLTSPEGYVMHMSDYAFIALCILMGMLFTYFAGYLIIGLYLFNKKWKQIYFVVVFILSVIGWTVVIQHCNKNVEVIEQSISTSSVDRPLVYFCNIPVQNISEASSSVGTGNFGETITTSDELSYWYLNGNGEAFYDSANAKTSKIVFIGNDEKPYVSIISYESQKITIDHNIVKKQVEVTGNWNQYVFYLPEAIMQYSLG